MFSIFIVLLLFSSCVEKNVEPKNSNEGVQSQVSTTEIEVDSPKDVFIPLSNGEHLVYEEKNKPSSSMVEIFIYAESEAEKRLLKIIDPKCIYPNCLICNNKLYYTEGLPDSNKEVSLMFFDSSTGYQKKALTSKITVYDVSTDSKYICYARNEHKKDTNWGPIYIPILYLSGPNANVQFDLIDSILSGEWGTLVSISFNELKNHFYIEFSLDAEANIGKGYISLDNFEFNAL